MTYDSFEWAEATTSVSVPVSLLVTATERWKCRVWYSVIMLGVHNIVVVRGRSMENMLLLHVDKLRQGDCLGWQGKEYEIFE
jgi:hypothetical protein